MSKKRVKFSENIVSDVFEFEKDYPHDLNHNATLSSVVKRSMVNISNSSYGRKEACVDEKLLKHYQDMDKDETGDKNIDFTGCLLDSESRDNHLDITKITGQENSTITNDGDITITPFNLNDEMEYGHFDGTGNFIFRREETEFQDNWFDSVDWDRLKESEEISKRNQLSFTNDERDESVLDVESTYTQIMDMLNDKETILKAIIRYGKNKSQKEILETLTELADRLLSNGEVNVYEFSKEIIQQKIKQKSSISVDDDDLESAFNHEAKSIPEPNGNTHSPDAPLWEYKWDNSKEAEIYGPFTTEQMAEWKNNGFFQISIYCRKISTPNSAESQSDFHSSNRIDFELYL